MQELGPIKQVDLSVLFTFEIRQQLKQPLAWEGREAIVPLFTVKESRPRSQYCV